jgi:hypothetical protein
MNMYVPPQVLEEMDRINAFLADVKQSANDHGFKISSATVKPDLVYSHHTMNVVFCTQKQ